MAPVGGSVEQDIFRPPLDASFEELLEELGMTLENTVRAVVYLADIDDFGEMNEAYTSYFQSFPAPSRVTVAVAGLVAGASIEISFIAVKN